MKIYTRKGDDGGTALFSGRRTAKSDPVVAAVGDLDALSAALGLALLAYSAAATELRTVQHNLYVVSAIISAEGKRPELVFPEAETDRLEALLDEVSAHLPELKDFIYPGQSEAGTRLHLARAIARRAERGVAALDTPAAPLSVLSYLNRLSDLLFVWARAADLDAGHESTPLASR